MNDIGSAVRNAVLKPGFKFSAHKVEAGVRLCRIEGNEEILEKSGAASTGRSSTTVATRRCSNW